jgi:hypothetical protein
VDDSVRSFFVVDRDGPIVESVPKVGECVSAWIKQRALSLARHRQGIFPSLDGMRFAWREEEVSEREDLTVQNRQAILVDNATRVFSLGGGQRANPDLREDLV